MIATYLYHSTHGKRRFEIEPHELPALYSQGWRETREPAKEPLSEPLQVIAAVIGDCNPETISATVKPRRRRK